MKKIFKNILLGSKNSKFEDIGILLMRILFGFVMVYQHGYGKLIGFSEYKDKHPDPLGIGSETSMLLMIFAEFFCAVAVAFGLLTRLAVIPLIIGLGVAFFVYHATHPFEHKELAYLYLSAYLILFFLGSGRFSLDSVIFGKQFMEDSLESE